MKGKGRVGEKGGGKGGKKGAMWGWSSKGKGKGWPTKFNGNCYVCGKPGHSSKYCWAVTELDDVEHDGQLDLGGRGIGQETSRAKIVEMITATTWPWRSRLHRMSPEEQQERIQRSMANAAKALPGPLERPSKGQKKKFGKLMKKLEDLRQQVQRKDEMTRLSTILGEALEFYASGVVPEEKGLNATCPRCDEQNCVALTGDVRIARQNFTAKALVPGVELPF